MKNMVLNLKSTLKEKNGDLEHTFCIIEPWILLHRVITRFLMFFGAVENIFFTLVVTGFFCPGHSAWACNMVAR